MDIRLDRIFERDIDLIVNDSFVNDEAFAELFFSKVGIAGAKVTGTDLSRTDIVLGESDITVFAEKEGIKYALLIEDKINAEAMDNQHGRYEERAEKLKEEGLADETFVMMIAPEAYYNTNAEAKKYEYYVSYESMIEYFSDKNSFKAHLLEKAKQKKEINPTIPDEAITKFWQDYYRFKRENYDHLNLPEYEGDRGSLAKWATFKTNDKNIEVWHKSERGFVDMQIKGLGGKEGYVKEVLKPYLKDGLRVVNTGKSAAVRLEVPVIDFSKSFGEYTEAELQAVFKAVNRLCELAEEINYLELCKQVNRLFEA